MGEPVEPVGVGHACLIEVDRGVLTNGELPMLDAVHERVEGECLPGQGGAVLAEALGRLTRTRRSRGSGGRRVAQRGRRRR